MPKEISRFAPPNSMDEQPYGTRCIVSVDDLYYDLYLQLSNEESQPKWEAMGRFRKDEQQTTEIELVTPDN